MRDFLTALAKAVKPNSTAWDNFQRMYVPAAQVAKSEPDSPLRTNILFKHIQVSFAMPYGVVTVSVALVVTYVIGAFVMFGLHVGLCYLPSLFPNPCCAPKPPPPPLYPPSSLAWYVHTPP